MFSAHRSIQAATALLVVTPFFSEMALPQTVKFAGHAADPLVRSHLLLGSNSCAKESGSPATAVPVRPEAASTGETPSNCDTPAVTMPAIKPCNASDRVEKGCSVPRDLVQLELDAMGKPGQKISRAREKVLEILQTQNACTAWFQQKDSNPAGTFRTLNFALDQHGEEFILENKDRGPTSFFRNPYVAKVIQGDGAYGKITLNPKGAFFSVMARVLEVSRDGGPSSMRGTRLLRVGPYDGDTLPAQVTTLLHEFGHVLDLLPTDQNNVDGKSVQNTREVLRVCSAEVASKSRRNMLAASR